MTQRQRDTMWVYSLRLGPAHDPVDVLPTSLVVHLPIPFRDARRTDSASSARARYTNQVIVARDAGVVLSPTLPDLRCLVPFSRSHRSMVLEQVSFVGRGVGVRVRSGVGMGVGGCGSGGGVGGLPQLRRPHASRCALGAVISGWPSHSRAAAIAS